ncbi:hypothetical protein UY3_15852 [Chelonia mydas]|uniref:Uncharacterized protein n=1 Tax=Chelonia mydas TaxID=8469 RepID=M7AR04_CHEMY|nr:hypothetical protein UY3_15852 [Chelonia mydas]
MELSWNGSGPRPGYVPGTKERVLRLGPVPTVGGRLKSPGPAAGTPGWQQSPWDQWLGPRAGSRLSGAGGRDPGWQGAGGRIPRQQQSPKAGGQDLGSVSATQNHLTRHRLATPVLRRCFANRQAAATCDLHLAWRRLGLLQNRPPSWAALSGNTELAPLPSPQGHSGSLLGITVELTGHDGAQLPGDAP